MPDFPFPLMIFAAGFGTRMGALTAARPKPLIPVAGRALIDHALLARRQGSRGSSSTPITGRPDGRASGRAKVSRSAMKPGRSWKPAAV
jgi:CTP:molybdopterin cytidylyltransferase MocA